MKLLQILFLFLVCTSQTSWAQSEDPTEKYIQRGVKAIDSGIDGCLVEYTFLSALGTRIFSVEIPEANDSLEKCRKSARDILTLKGTVERTINFTEIPERIVQGKIIEARYKFANIDRMNISTGLYRVVTLKNDLILDNR